MNVAFSQQSYFVHIHFQKSNFSITVNPDQGYRGGGLLLLYIFRDLMSKVTIDDECIFDGLQLIVKLYYRTSPVNMIGYSSNAIVCATEIKNSTFLDTSLFVDQHHFPGGFNLIKVSLHDVRMIYSILLAQGIQRKMILEINNIHYLCLDECGSYIQIISLANLSISSSLESQSHFEFVAISVIDTDVHLSGSLSFKKQFTHFGGNLPPCSSRAAVCHVC